MKKSILTFVAILSFLYSSAQEFVYYPKEVKITNEEETYTDKYMVNGEGQITQIISLIEYKLGGSSLISYEFCIIPKYDNKKGIIKGAKVYEYYNYRDQTIDKNEYYELNYTFNYVSETNIKVNVTTSLNAVRNEREQHGEVIINEKGELVSSDIDGYRNKPSYDNKGNMTANEDEPELQTFIYNEQKGALSDITTPKWLIPVLSRFNHSRISETFIWGNMVNAVTESTKVKIKDADHKKNTKFTYQYNEEGYPVAMDIESTDMSSDLEVVVSKGEIKYSKKKAKK